MNTWNLNDLYKGFDQTYENDLKKLEELVDKIINHLNQDNIDDHLFIEKYLKYDEEFSVLILNLYNYASLIMSCDVSNIESQQYISRIINTARKLTKDEVRFQRYLTGVNLDSLAKKSELINKYLFNLKKSQKNAKYLLSESEEVLYSKLSELASDSWEQVQNLATANLMITIDSKEYTFSDVRNFAYDADPILRKKAYEAELEAYTKVDDFVSLALVNIKREVNTINELRGYNSALEKTLLDSNMKQETLNAMIDSMMDYRVHFSKYLKAKAKYLNNETSLPFYDLFAPVGKQNKTYTYEDAKDLIIKAFSSYSTKLGDYAKRAFENEWIDVYPKKGKRGGAFCANLPQIKQSRILTNFTSSLSDVLTLAHELGHGYHGDIISHNAPLHWNYPMPLAETASIFCETIVNNYLLESITDDEERLSILENSLQSDTQVIIDILSRYLFETKLIENATQPISKDELNKWMIESQKDAYLDGLNKDLLHPYMWLVKGHYYSAGLNFYNFPYAFGLLFGKGLYAQYLKNKDIFVKNYDKLLEMTTKNDCEAVASMMNIDVTAKDFWIDSLEQIKKDIDEVCDLLKKAKKNK